MTSVFCDECERELLGDYNHTTDGEDVLCSKCYRKHQETRLALECEKCRTDEPAHRMRQCHKCHRRVPQCALIEKLEGRKLCAVCAHSYELQIFTPPDHSAAECQLCIARK